MKPAFANEGRDGRPLIAGRRIQSSGGSCYGTCCQRYARGGDLCTKCRRYFSRRTVCCGYTTVHVSPRMRVPRQGASGRWREFIKRFPEFKFREELKHVPVPEPPAETGEVMFIGED